MEAGDHRESAEVAPTTKQEIQSDKKKTKNYFCPFSKELTGHFARHLVNKHKLEDEVMQFINLETKSEKKKENYL